eukprot:2040180-Amphidinium_carterae.1
MWIVPKLTEAWSKPAQGSASTQRVPPQSRQPPKQSAASSARPASSAQRMPTGTTSATLKNGKEVCAAWNEGQCKEPCPQNKLHVCNAVISKNGR